MSLNENTRVFVNVGLCVCMCTHSQGLSSLGLLGISSTHSAGNQPTFPRALPSQNPPSPILRTTVHKGRESAEAHQILFALFTDAMCCPTHDSGNQIERTMYKHSIISEIM